MPGGENCAIPGCHTQRGKCRGLSFHRLPKLGKHDEWRAALMGAIDRESFNPQRATICSRHFKDICFRTVPTAEECAYYQRVSRKMNHPNTTGIDSRRERPQTSVMMASSTKKRTGGNSCCAINCTNSRYKCPGKSFFRFPKDEARCRDWIQMMRRGDLLKRDVKVFYRAGYFLCSDHFEDSQFMNVNEKKKLIWSAVPSIFNIPNPAVTSSRPTRKRVLTPEQQHSTSKRTNVTGLSGKRTLIPGSLPTEMMPTKYVVTLKPPPRKDWVSDISLTSVIEFIETEQE